MSTLELCEKYFDTRDVYKLFDVEKTAVEKDIKKSYHKLSLLVHPDRVPESQKEIATEKFKLLSKLYQILVDKDKRALYDEKGIIDDDNLEGRLSNWLELWKNLFKPLTEDDINNYEKSYVGSDLEKMDIKKAYLSGKGCINFIINSVPFMKVENEPRLQDIVKEMIGAGDVPEYKVFTEEPEQKRKKRYKKYAREFKEYEKMKARINSKNQSRADSSSASSTTENGSLEQAIMARQKARENGFNTLIDKVMEKYGHDDGEEDVVIDVSQKIRKSKKKPQKKDSKEKVNSPLHGVKSGRVKKH